MPGRCDMLGLYVCQSAIGAVSGFVGICVGCWERVVRHSVKVKKKIVSCW